MIAAVTGMFLAAVQIAGPLLVVLFLADVGLGLLTRVAPALNAFALGFPLKILLTLTLAGFVFLALPGSCPASPARRSRRCWGWADGGFTGKDRAGHRQADEGGPLQGPALPVPGPHRLARRRRRRASCCPATIDRASNAATDQLFSVRGVIADPDPAKAVDGAGGRARRPWPGSSARMFVVVVRRGPGRRPRCRAASTSRSSSASSSSSTCSRAQADLRRPGALGGREGAAEGQPSSASCCTPWCRG